MADAGFFKGTSADQDSRFTDKDQKLRRTLKFPPEYEQKVDMKKVALAVIRPWVVKRVEEILGFDDEVVVEYVTQQLEDGSKAPDPKDMQIKMTGFLSSKTPEFMLALWKILLSAQNSPGGVPREFVEEKKLELRQKNDADTHVMQEASRRQGNDRQHNQRLDDIRERERRERWEAGGGRGRGGGFGRGRGQDSGWGARGRGPPPTRGGYGPPRDNRDRSRSPPRRGGPPPPARYRSGSPRRARQRSASYSRSRTPPRRRSQSRSHSRSPPPPPRARYRSPPRNSKNRSITPPVQGRPRRSPSPEISSRRRPVSRSTSRSPPPRSTRDRRPRSRSRSRSPNALARRVAPRASSRDKRSPADVRSGGRGGLNIKGAAARARHTPPRSRSRSANGRTRRRSYSRSPSRSVSPPPRRTTIKRGSRSPSLSSRRGGGLPKARPKSTSRSPSRSRSPVDSRATSGRRRRHSPSESRSRSRSRPRSASPEQSGSGRPRRGFSPPYKRARRGDSRSPSPRRSKRDGSLSERGSARGPLEDRISTSKRPRDDDRMDVDSRGGNPGVDLNRAERDAKEKLLRQKVVRSRSKMEMN